MLERLVEERVTGFPLVPTMSAILLQMDLDKYDLSAPALRHQHRRGLADRPHPPVPRAAAARADLLDVRADRVQAGLLPAAGADRRAARLGRQGMPNEEVYLVDERGPPRRARARSGELVVRGSNVMRATGSCPRRPTACCSPGPLPGEKVLYTGDLFRMDEEGYLYFVGRKDDIIKSRGEKVSPKEVENVLYSHPARGRSGRGRRARRDPGPGDQGRRRARRGLPS